MIQQQTTFHHTANFPLFFDLVLERGTEMVEIVQFVPGWAWANQTLVWLIQRDNAPVLALQVVDSDSGKSGLWLSQNGSVTINLHTALSRQLKPYAYRHVLMMKDNATGDTETLLVGTLTVEQHSRMWQEDGQNVPTSLPDIGDQNGNGVPDNLDGVFTGLFNLDPLLRQLVIETTLLEQQVRTLSVSLSFV